MKRIISILLITFIVLTLMPCAFAEEGVVIELSSGGYVNINEPLGIEVSYAGMEDCIVYIGANEIAGGKAEESTFSALADISTIPYVGNATLTAVAVLEDGSKVSATEDINLVKLTDPITKFDQQFSDLDAEHRSDGSVSILDMIIFTQGVSTIKPYERAEGDVALQLAYDKPHYSPFMYKASLGISDGSLIEICFDVMFDSAEDSLTLNYRYNTSDVPTGKIGKYFYQGLLGNSDTAYEAGVWYSAKVVVDTYGDGSNKFYVKGGEIEDYTLFAESSSFVSTGLNQVRIELSNASGGSYYLDNFSIKYRTIANTCAVTPSFSNDEGAADAFSAGVSSVILGTASERIALTDKVVIKNESGDIIPANFALEADALTLTLSPLKPFNYGRKYYIEIPSSIKAEAGTKVHIADPFVFFAEKSSKGIEKVLKTSDGVKVFLKDVLALAENSRIVAVSYNGLQAIDVNVTNIIEEGEYEMTLSEGESVKVYLYDGNTLIDEVEF